MKIKAYIWVAICGAVIQEFTQVSVRIYQASFGVFADLGLFNSDFAHTDLINWLITIYQLLEIYFFRKKLLGFRGRPPKKLCPPLIQTLLSLF